MEIKTYRLLVSEIDKRCEIAIRNVAEVVRDKLEYFIKEDFYEMYKPKFYDRSYRFLKSPKFNILGKGEAEVFIDTDVMHYLGISGEEVARLASLGFHGSKSIFREGYYWSSFMEWVDSNVINLLKEELKKQGINVN